MITITQVIQPPTVPAVTIVSLVGATISAAVVILDPDGVLAGQGVPVYQITGVCALGQLSIGADGVAVLSASAVGSVAVPFTVTVGATVLTSSIQVVVTDPDAPRPRIVSFPATESGLAGAAWIYDLTIDPASLAADAQLTLSVQSLVPALANASWTAVSGTRFQIVVPSLDPSGGEIQRMQVVVTDAVNQSVDIQVILLVVLPPASTG